MHVNHASRTPKLSRTYFSRLARLSNNTSHLRAIVRTRQHNKLGTAPASHRFLTCPPTVLHRLAQMDNGTCPVVYASPSQSPQHQHRWVLLCTLTWRRLCRTSLTLSTSIWSSILHISRIFAVWDNSPRRRREAKNFIEGVPTEL